MKFPRSWGALRALLNISVQTKIKHILVTVAVAFGVFSLVFSMLETNGNRDLQREKHNNDVLTYQAAVRLYDTQVIQVDQCNSRYDTRQAVRAVFIGQNEMVRSMLTIIDEANPDPPSAILLSLFNEVNLQEARIVDEYPENEQNECPEMPTPPEVPESLVERTDVPTTTTP